MREKERRKEWKGERDREKPTAARARREDERDGLLSPFYGHKDGGLPCFQVPRF
jgi:hypothetical protein